MQLSIPPMQLAIVPNPQDAPPPGADVWETGPEKATRNGLPDLRAYVSACRRCLQAAIAAPAVFLLAAMLAAFMTGPSYGAECDPYNPQPGELCGVGRYLQDSEELRLRILQLRKQLDECGDCGDRDALEQAFNAAVEQRNTTRAGEGIALKALGLPGDNFEGLSV